MPYRKVCLSFASIHDTYEPALSLSYVPLIAPSTSLSRIEFLASIADTFIYIVSKVRVAVARNVYH